MLLRNRIIAFLENASVEVDGTVRRAMLTMVVAGGGFAGVDARQAQDKIYEWELGGNTSSASGASSAPAAPAVVDLSGNWICLKQMSAKLVITIWATIMPTNDGACELDPTKISPPLAGTVLLSRNDWYMTIKINGNKLEGAQYTNGSVTPMQCEMDAGNDGFIVSGVVSGQVFSYHWTRQK